MMQAAFIRQTGGPELITVGELPIAELGPTDALVQMHVSTVNHVDCFVRSGAYQTFLPYPFILGRDLVGTVVDVSPGVADYQKGDRVWSNSLGYGGRQGAFAQYAVVSTDRLYHLPEGISPVEAAPVLHTAATAHLGLVRDAELTPSDTIFVAGGAGGVGSSLIQLAAVMGARVIASASTQDHQWCQELGADVVLDYRDETLHDKIAAAAPHGIDIWWDTSGHHNFEAALPLLNIGARILVMAGIAAKRSLPVGQLYTRDIQLLSFAMSNASVTDLANAAQTINTYLARGNLRARVGQTYRLSQAAEAHEAMEQNALRGRILVVP